MLEGRSKQDDQVTRSRWDLLDHLMYLIFETGHLKSVYEATNKDVMKWQPIVKVRCWFLI